MKEITHLIMIQLQNPNEENSKLCGNLIRGPKKFNPTLSFKFIRPFSATPIPPSSSCSCGHTLLFYYYSWSQNRRRP